MLQDLQGDLNDAFSMTLNLDALEPVVTASTLSTDDVIAPGALTVTLTFSELEFFGF